MTAREETVLRPTDPAIADENDWPEFSLTDVKVLRPGKKLYANLLEAHDQNPVQVIGCLELKKDQEHLALDPDSLSKRIVIDDVVHYAYGQTEDRSVELWVAGKAGWYQISPAKNYLPTFNRMVQAVDMYYFLMDKHQHGKKRLNPSFKSLCDQYTFHTHGDCETREQSAEEFAGQAPFLIRCMIEDEDDLAWKKTHVFVHFRRHFNVSNRCRASPQLVDTDCGSFQDVYTKTMELLHPNSTDDEDASEETPVSTPRPDPAVIAKSQTQAIYQLIRDLREEGHLAKRRLHIDLLTERLSDRYSFSKENARKIIDARASAVVEKLDDEDTPGFRWSRYVIHRELTNAANHSNPLPPALLTPLQPLEDSSDEEDLARTQKSVLRPKTHSVSNKLMGKRNRNGTVNPQTDQADEHSEDGEDETMEDVDTPSKTRGHELIRTPLASAKPQSRSTLSEDGPAATLLKKMLRETHQPPPNTTPNTSSTTLDLNATLPPIDLNGTTESETWTCRMAGCAKVLTSKGTERKKEIEKHASEHDWDTQMRVELVETERRMHTALPVSNLMQYLVNQHYQQMRAAFPEIYPVENGVPNGTGVHPEPSTSTPTPQPSIEQDEEVLG
ncbi:hypothetical protein N7492_010613 [Penicillium capsulatum]|uniref:DNA (cytosine-5)-methyltransferase 1 replication foci domain-containing protein n=1 Tax=Penicillium capsulatum TaxID=69766 RepID=A0A9W9LF93_9EURO|nr:hypothetical protein N7492_010613 [Penicillium capsulatum]KAJ6113112.1 hypothetical protein N7512_008436 [Penicillium capsulatum]